MSTLSAKGIYDQLVKHLPPEERMQLIEMVNRDLVSRQADAPETHKRSLKELHGLGAAKWEGIDAQEYVDDLRKEWDHRP